MYHDLSQGRCLGQMHIVMDPERFVGLDQFKKSMSQVCDELGAMPAAEGYGKVYYPGERAVLRRDKAYAEGGIEVVDEGGIIAIDAQTVLQILVVLELVEEKMEHQQESDQCPLRHDVFLHQVAIQQEQHLGCIHKLKEG